MFFRRLHLALGILLLTALPLSAQVQKSAASWSEWETISPEGEEFTVLMPKNPTTETTKFPYHKMELNSRLYLAKSPAGPVLAVVSLSGIKSNPAAYSDFQRFNSYVDAFKDFFPPKVRTKETAIARLTLVSSRPFNGHTGRSYKMTVGELSGVVHAFATRKRFYAIVSLNTKKDEPLEEKFLSSFVLPERQPDPQPKPADTIANNGRTEVAPEQGKESNNPNEVELTGTPEQNAAAEAANTKGDQPNQQNQALNNLNQKRPIAGGVLNGKALYLPKPEVYDTQVSGVVLVQVLVDEQGTVIEAKAVSGPQQLHAAAVNAARLARFMPTLLSGVPVQVSGTLSYNFMRQN